ncbi:multifunctional CCA addition/repair protein [Teredinibacter sp. KSP-S5-2]|uniref:multifunctional CCA addition/repair protein n=1 Tax=Teredinibacter sp. KSP-S5-2 TaxID=3034506 RepID=UPI002934C97E|nr:multifunctional CCA addition/repair protein [Teredinibacter sp. KSP-S5-2]WNO08606.1 multifunctional CCA addition/repair protein [Teredinibacter sp. KSP-S5-2]
MQIFLVGGAVRDKLLGYPYSEKDWVVVGATHQEMIEQGFTQVGKDFPVYLHPQTKDEYALARTERKTGNGYTGFQFNSDPTITLEEDLARRDLTINAIAETETGDIVDPYNGQRDIQNKILRHVSHAFTEDPVRILRVARFAARYAHLGFTLAEETRLLMEQMVLNGEVDHLVSERIWKELYRALSEPTPTQFIETLRSCHALKKIMPELDALFGVPQPEQHHPEIDTGVHALLSLKRAASLSDSTRIRFAALIHDLGKGTTPEETLPHHYGHEEEGVALVDHLCNRLSAPNEYRDLARICTRFHTHCHKAFELKPSTLLKVLEQTDAYRKPDRFEEFLICCQADAQGRTGKENTAYPQAEFLHRAYQVTSNINVKALLEQGITGKDLGEAIRRERLRQLKILKQAENKPNAHTE